MTLAQVDALAAEHAAVHKAAAEAAGNGRQSLADRHRQAERGTINDLKAFAAMQG